MSGGYRSKTHTSSDVPLVYFLKKIVIGYWSVTFRSVSQLGVITLGRGNFTNVNSKFSVQILPYLWRLASSDTTLRWRLAAALILLVASKVRL